MNYLELVICVNRNTSLDNVLCFFISILNRSIVLDIWFWEEEKNEQRAQLETEMLVNFVRDFSVVVVVDSQMFSIKVWRRSIRIIDRPRRRDDNERSINDGNNDKKNLLFVTLSSYQLKKNLHSFSPRRSKTNFFIIVVVVVFLFYLRASHPQSALILISRLFAWKSFHIIILFYLPGLMKYYHKGQLRNDNSTNERGTAKSGWKRRGKNATLGDIVWFRVDVSLHKRREHFSRFFWLFSSSFFFAFYLSSKKKYFIFS